MPLARNGVAIIVQPTDTGGSVIGGTKAAVSQCPVMNGAAQENATVRLRFLKSRPTPIGCCGVQKNCATAPRYVDSAVRSTP